MNKRHYKVIFSRVLNQLVVVSELAKSQGKAQSENVSSEQEKTGLFSTALSLNPIHFSLMLALGFVFLPSVHAEDMAIRADKSAPGNQQPTVLQTANGLPQVNIQTPSAGGVSRNQYSQFDVAEKGAVLNNARKAAQTQMAGWVQGNPNLSRGEAKVILNEVNSANPSRLKGYVEVAGKKADVVIANPSGIQCDGCGVINAGRTTLTTGKAEVENGELKGYRVKGGKVTVGQKGMDNSQSDYTDIIADKAEIKGGVWSKKGIKVTTGKNNVDRTNDSVVYVGDKNTDNTDRTSDTQGENQSYSVDVSQLGGMYAEKIHLVDNGQGLGVRNAGHIGASEGEVKIDSQGRIINEGVISGKQNVQIKTKSDVIQKGKVETARGDVLVNAKNQINQVGATISGGHIRYQADSVEAGKSSVLAAGIEENGKVREIDEVSETKNLEIKTAKTTVAKGKNIASGKVDIQAQTVDVSESQTSGQDVHIVAHQGEMNANQATLIAKNEINLHTPSQLLTQHANLKADWINATAQRVENQQGRWASQGARDFSLNLEQGLNNEKGLILSGGNMSLTQQNQFLNNREGQLLSGKDLTLTALSVDNQAGMIVADGSSTLNIARDINNQKVGNTGSLIQAQGDLTVNTTNLNNQNTKGNAQSVPTQGILAGKVEVNTQQLDNKQGGIYSVSSQVLNVVNQLDNTQGELFSTGDIRIQGKGASIKNSQGSIQAAEKLNIQVNALSGDGDIEANHANIQLVQDFDSQRDLVGRSSLSLTTQGHLINRAGLLSEGHTQINAKNIENTKTAEIQGKQTALISEQNITNRGLVKGTVENVIKTGDTLTNIGTGRIYGGHVALQAGQKIVNTDELQSDGTIKSAVVAAKERLDVAAPFVENSKTVFTQNWAFNGIGGSLSSEGKVVFGRTLDENNQSKDLGDKLLNSGSLIEGRGVVLGMHQTLNKNARIDTRLEEVKREEVKEHYLVEGGNPNANERINFNLLKWVPFSRAGKVAYNTDNRVMTTDANIDGKIIAQPGENICVNESNCSTVEYNKNDPIWAALGVTPPKTEAPNVTVPKELLIKPEEPEMPARMYFGNTRFHKKKMQEYELKLAEYKVAMKAYEEKLEPYKEQLAPYFKWQLENEPVFKALSDAIEAHNRKIEGKRFTNFWDINVKERITSETKVKETHPGKILSQGDVEFNGNVENNRSQIMAAGKIYNPNTPSEEVNNVPEMGITRVVDNGNQEWTYSRWRGGFKRYHQRDRAGRHDYQKITDTPLDLKQVRTEAYTTVTPEGEKANLSMETLALANNIHVANGVNQSNAKAGQREIRTIGADVSLPTSSLYRTNPEATNRPLIETDPQFTDRKQWLSGDYMFKALRSDPQNILRRLGDGYYEQRLVRDQVNQLTGRMFLTGYQDLEAQYKGLMDNGITFAKRFNLTPGVALSPAQVAQLTSDIVWFEEKEVTLPSGKQVKVMAPRVYAMAQKGDLNGEGALISADVIDLRSNRLTNSGTIAGRKLTLLNTESLFNAGTITGDKVGIKTTNNFDNIGGKVEAERALLVDVGGDLNHESTTMTTKVDLSHFQRSETTLARKALFHVKGEDGQLQLSSNNLNAKGADIINDGNGSTLVQSKNNVNLTALSVGFDEKMGKGNHYRHEKVEEAVVSQVKGKGDVTLTAKNLRAEGAQLESKAKLMAIAENDLVLNGAKESRDFEEFHKTKSGSLARTTKTSLDQQHSVTQVGTQVSGKEVVLSAGHDVKAKGMQAIADNDLHIQAGHDVDIAADTNHFKNKRVETKKTRGVFTDGGIGFTVGSKSEKHDYETEGWTQSDARSTLGSMNGNITVSAGNHSNVMGTDMITPNTNRIDIKGASVKVEAGKDIIERKEGHEYKQSGVTIALSTPVTDMAQAAYNSVNRSQQVTNGKLKALYAVKAAEEATMAAQNVGKVAETLDALRAGNMQNTGTTSSPSMKVSLGYGSQKQMQSSESQSISHQKSTVSTGTLNIKARDEKLTFEGVDANAKLMALSGKKGIEIKGVKDEEHQRTENKSAGGSVGVFVGTNGNSYGVGIEGSVNAAKGKSNSDSERWQNSHLQADKLITNSEAGNLSLDAANLKAKRWEADIQNLTVTSRQDTEKYESKQTSASASGSVAQGAGGGASVSTSYNKAKVDYAQVNEQAGIRVGEDGMDAHIHNHTQLNGAIIESDADASKNHFKTKSLTHTDIENKSEIKTESASISAGTGGINPMQAISSALSLLGNTNESARSTTQSAISDNIQIDTETPENLTALSRDTKNANQRVEKQDLQKVQERQEMAKVIGDISNNAINIATYNEREKINKLGLEKFKLEEQEKALKGQAGNEQQLAAIKQQLTNVQTEITKTQGEIDRTYGIGSKTGMAIRAVTAALQVAAQNDTAGSLVALASPYLNKTIHEMTAGDTAKDKATNLMAHALLSAVEFQVTGKDPLTGAVAGVTGEVTAQILTQAIYNKTPNQLTANEKENISTLSQLAGGLAAALTAKANGTTAEQGGSFLAATSGTETAKRAVENNFLSDASRARLNALKTKYHRGEQLTNKEKLEFRDLIESDQRSDVLLDKFRKDPNSLNSKEREAFLSYVDRYYIETVTGNTASGYKLAPSTSLVNAQNRFESEYLINDPVPKRDYGHFPFAGTDVQRSQAVNTLPEESKNWLGWRSEKHSRDEEMYYTVKNELDAPENYKNSANGKIAYSVKDGLESASMIYGVGVLSNALSKVPATVNALNLPNKVVSATAKVGDFAKAHPILTEKVVNSGTSMGFTYLGNSLSGKETSMSDLAWSAGTGFVAGGTKFGTTLAINSVSGGVQGYFEENDEPVKHAGYKAASSGIATLVGGGIGKGIEKSGFRVLAGNVSRNKDYYEPLYRNQKFYNLLNEEYKYIPTKIGTIGDSLSSEYINNKLEKNEPKINSWLKGENDAK